jgi:Zn-dependent peptidase ImmA (M78 family)
MYGGVLVPKHEIQNCEEPINYEELAKQFKVSQIVIARRLLDLGKIKKKEIL